MGANTSLEIGASEQDSLRTKLQALGPEELQKHLRGMSEDRYAKVRDAFNLDLMKGALAGPPSTAALALARGRVQTETRKYVAHCNSMAHFEPLFEFYRRIGEASPWLLHVLASPDRRVRDYPLAIARRLKMLKHVYDKTAQLGLDVLGEVLPLDTMERERVMIDAAIAEQLAGDAATAASYAILEAHMGLDPALMSAMAEPEMLDGDDTVSGLLRSNDRRAARLLEFGHRCDHAADEEREREQNNAAAILQQTLRSMSARSEREDPRRLETGARLLAGLEVHGGESNPRELLEALGFRPDDIRQLPGGVTVLEAAEEDRRTMLRSLQPAAQ